MNSDASVAIVGGGPCGLMMALLLARSGVRCVVFEKKSGISTHPKAMGISRRTSEIYRQLGLLEAIKSGCLPDEGRFLSIWSKSLIGEELGRVPFAETLDEFSPCSGLHCPQTWTENVLLNAVVAEPLAEVRFNCEAIGVGHFLNVMFRANYGTYLRQRPAILYPTVSNEYFEFFVAVNGDNLWLMHHFLQPDEKPQDFPVERMQGVIREASGRPAEPVEIISIMPWVMSPKVAQQYRIGRVFLVGDAAARLSPSGGLGLNTGLQSAHNLAWKLASVILGRAGDTLLDTYQEERRDAAFWTMQNTNRNSDEIFAVAQSALENDWDRVRNVIAQSRRRGTGLGQDLGISYSRGALLTDDSDAPVVEDPINDYEPSARPGSRAPHLWIEQQGIRLSTLDLFGRTFVLLTGRDYQSKPPGREEVTVAQNGKDFTAQGFEGLYGITGSGAVLVRPDGYVGARWTETDKTFPDGFQSTLIRILRLRPDD